MHPRERVLSDLELCRQWKVKPPKELQQRAEKWGVDLSDHYPSVNTSTSLPEEDIEKEK